MSYLGRLEICDSINCEIRLRVDYLYFRLEVDGPLLGRGME